MKQGKMTGREKLFIWAMLIIAMGLLRIAWVTKDINYLLYELLPAGALFVWAVITQMIEKQKNIMAQNYPAPKFQEGETVYFEEIKCWIVRPIKYLPEKKVWQYHIMSFSGEACEYSGTAIESQLRKTEEEDNE